MLTVDFLDLHDRRIFHINSKKLTTLPNRYDRSIMQNQYVRPKTRGELAKRLKNGETCEVASHVSEMTSYLIQWLDVWNFRLEFSTNPGWVLFIPEKKIDNPSQSV